MAVKILGEERERRKGTPTHAVRVDEKWGYVDKASRWVIPPSFTHAERFGTDWQAWHSAQVDGAMSIRAALWSGKTNRNEIQFHLDGQSENRSAFPLDSISTITR